MFRDLFSNRLFLGAFAFFVLIVVGGTMYLKYVKRQTQQEIERTEEAIKRLNENQNAKPTAEAPVAAETTPQGHFHDDGTFHAQPHAKNGEDTAARPASDEDWSDVTPEQRAQIEKMRARQLADYVAKWGEPPSPDASYKHYRDNHGNVHRHYRGTVTISDYEFRTMFAPTPVELERYKQLRAALKDATSADEINGGSWENPSAEVQRLDNEIKSLVDNAQREIPHPFGFGYFGPSISPAEEKRLDAIAIRDFYQRFGMEHLYELHNEPTKFYQKY